MTVTTCSVCSREFKNVKAMAGHMHTHTYTPEMGAAYSTVNKKRWSREGERERMASTFKMLGARTAVANKTSEMRDAFRRAQLRRFSDPAERASYSRKFSGSGNPRWQEDREHLTARQEFELRTRSSLKQAKKRIFNGDLDFVIEELGYTARQLKAYLELQFTEGMSWDNWGTIWQVDHIVPVSRHEINISIRAVNALSNLRPLWKTDNLSKGRRLDREWRAS